MESSPEKNQVKLEDIKAFGNKLKEARNKLGKKQKKVAAEVGVTGRLIFNWESADSFPTEDKLPDIARVYNIDLAELTDIFERSKEARELEKKARRSLQKRFDKQEPTVEANISGRRIRPKPGLDSTDPNRF